jgi:hypothetical protein
MITKRDHDAWRVLALGDFWDHSVQADVVAATRALADWTADILTVLRAVAVFIPEVGDSKAGSLFWHAERLHAGLTTLVTGGTASTDLTPDLLTTWERMSGENPRKVLTYLADEFGHVLYMLNVMSDSPYLRSVASESEGKPYWHAGKAHVAVLTLLTGSAEDGRAVHDYWSGNQEDTVHNLGMLAQDKRAASAIVTVAADGNTAMIELPSLGELTAGRVANGGLFWVADEVGTVVGHGSSWAEVGTLLATHYGHGDAPVIVEYALDMACTPGCATDDEGRPREPQTAICGACGKSWCERCHPAPSARCHFEYDHEDVSVR